MTPPTITIAGAELQPDPSGALYWPDEETLIVADLHLEKGSAFARRGVFLPPYDTRVTLARLERICEKFMPRRVIALGDSFHDPSGPERLGTGDAALIHDLTRKHDFVWISGNHDGLSPACFRGAVREELKAGPLLFRHLPGKAAPPGEIAGHLHPCASIALRGRRLRRRCFVGDGTRLILPAFGAFTGGLDLFDRAFAGLFARRATAWLLGEDAVYAFSELDLASTS